MSYKRCNAEFYYVGKMPHIRIGRPSLQRGVILKWFYSPRAVVTRTFVGDAWALTSAVLVVYVYTVGDVADGYQQLFKLLLLYLKLEHFLHTL